MPEHPYLIQVLKSADKQLKDAYTTIVHTKLE